MVERDETEPAEPTPPPKKKRRRARRFAAWTGGVLFGLPLFLVGVVLVLITTNPGLELVRRAAVPIASGVLTGELEVGEISGSLLSRLVIRDLSLTDDTGREAVALEKLVLAWSPTALLDGAIEVERLHLEAPRVVLVQTATGGLNLARLVPPSDAPPSPPSDKPLSLPLIRAGEVSIARGEVDFISDGERLVDARELGLSLTATASGDRVEATLAELTARVQDGLPLSLRTGAVLEGSQLEIDDLRLDLADGRVRVPRLSTELPPGPLEGRAYVDVPARLVRRVGGPEALLADAKLGLRARRAAEAPRWTARVDGTLSGAPVALSATVTESLDEVEAELDATRLDPSALWRGLPRAALDLDLSARGDVAAPDLRASLVLEGWLVPEPGAKRVDVRPLRVDARWRGETAEATAKGRVGGARLDLDAALSELSSGTPVVDRGRVDLEVPELRAVVGSAASGRVALTATVSGPVDALAAAGELDASGLAVGSDIRVRSVRGRWDLSGIPSAPDGHAQLTIGAVKLPGRSLDGAKLRLHAATKKGDVRVDVARFAITAGDLTFRGEGAHFVRSRSGALSLHGFGLRSAAGGFSLDGEIGAPGPARGSIDAELKLDALDLGRLPRSLAPELAELGGTIDGRVEAARKHGRTRAAVDLRLDGFHLAEGRPEISGKVDARLVPGELTAKVDLQGLGESFFVEAELPAPRDATRPAGWRRVLRRGPVRQIRVDIAGLDLERVQRLAGAETEITGLVDLEARVLRGGRSATLDLTTQRLNLGSPIKKAEAGLDAHLRFGDRRANAYGRIDGAPIGFGTFTATVAGPDSLFDTGAWAKLDQTAVRGARIDFESLRLAALEELGLIQGVSGQVDVNITAERAARPLTADVNATKVEVPWIEGVWGTELSLKLNEKDTRTSLRVRLDDGDVLTARASAPLDLEGLIAAKPGELAEVPLDAQVEVKGLRMSRLTKAAGFEKDQIKGELYLDLEAKGPAGNLDAKLDLGIRELVIAERKFDTLGAEATLKGRDFTAGARFSAAGAGGITLDAEGTIGDEGVSTDATLTGDGLPLRFLSQLGLTPLGLDGALHADATLKYGPDELIPNGWIELRGVRVVFAQSALQPLYDGKLRVELDPDEARVALGAKSMGGSIDASATADLSDFSAPKLTAKAKLEDFPVNAGQLARVDLGVDVDGQVDPDEGTKIDVLLHDGFVTLPDESTRSLHPITSPSEVSYVSKLGKKREKPKTSTTAEGAPVIVTIDLSKPIDVRGGPVDARLDLDLVSRTNVSAQPGLRGQIWIPEGTVELLGREYRIERARISLEGRDPPNPRIDIRLVHLFNSVGLEFAVRVTGYADDPQVEFASSPARYSDSELLQIFTGTNPSELGRASDRPPEAAAAGAAVGFLAGQIQNELGKALPLDTLEVDASEQGISNLTVGKWITREVFLAYRQDFEANPNENQFEAVIEYRFLPGWLAELVIGQIRNDLDILWINRW